MFQTIKEKDSSYNLSPLIHVLRLGLATVMLSGCANQIKMGQLSKNCDKESPIEQAKSPAHNAVKFYEEFYGKDDDEDCTTAKKQVGLLRNDSMPYKDVKDNIKTRQCYHDAVLAYQSWVTNHSLYLLGFEKPRNNADAPYQLSPDDQSAPVTFNPEDFSSSVSEDEDAVSDTQTYIRKVLNDGRSWLGNSMVLTHILRVKSTTQLNIDGANRDECFVYNIYANNELKRDAPPWCTDHQITKPSESNTKWTQDGWKAIDLLGKQIRDEIDQKTRNNKAPTHIIMLATGWNTRERESLLDFQKWMDELQKNFEKNGETFNPIFIGIASELEWPGKGKAEHWWQELKFYYSMLTKGRDADEIGFTWINYLLNSTLKPIAKDTGIQLVGIGHSFGSRVILGSHYTRNIFSGRDLASEEVPVTLIGMQAALPTGRFSSTRGNDNLEGQLLRLIGMQAALPTGRFSSTRGNDNLEGRWLPLPHFGLYKSHPYLGANKGAATVVITTSKSDKATGFIKSGYFMSGFIGGLGGLSELDNYPEDYKSFIKNIGEDKVDEKGQISIQPDKNLVSLYDASNFVCCEISGTESGSHSDVYDEEMGNFLGQIIRATSTNKN